VPYFLQRAQRKPAGSLIIGGHDQDTLMCLHCQFVWVPEPGSGHKRGWCFNCEGPTCGKQACETSCQHWEKVIEEVEARGRVEANLAAIRGV
jgi:hypothetical protein